MLEAARYDAATGDKEADVRLSALLGGANGAFSPGERALVGEGTQVGVAAAYAPHLFHGTYTAASGANHAVLRADGKLLLAGLSGVDAPIT